MFNVISRTNKILLLGDLKSELIFRNIYMREKKCSIEIRFNITDIEIILDKMLVLDFIEDMNDVEEYANLIEQEFSSGIEEYEDES